MSSTLSNPKKTGRIDSNASAPNRLRRNMQRLARANFAASGEEVVVSPGTGLVILPTGLAISMITESQVTGLIADLAARMFASTTLSTAAPITGGGNLSTGLTIGETKAGSTTNGWLSSTDWNAFHAGGGGSGVSTSISTVGPLMGGGPTSTNLTLSITQVSASTNGYLSSTQFNDIAFLDAANVFSQNQTFNSDISLTGATPSTGGVSNINFNSVLSLNDSGAILGPTQIASYNGATDTTLYIYVPVEIGGGLTV